MKCICYKRITNLETFEFSIVDNAFISECLVPA